jgi:uncharacterized membrane-anchored protein YjiN (DUF445 family)
VKTVLLFAAPPLAGALIGFVTNVIAIRMLFRPLAEIRVCGIRLPFTPGILPRQRHRLAESIGAMVERELLTPELLRQRLGREDVREQAYRSVTRFTATMLAQAISGFIGPEQLDRSVCELLGLGDMEGRIGDLVEAKLREHAPAITARILEEAERLYPALMAECIDLLRRPETHRELETRCWIFLNRTLEKLNMFQRFFLSAARYDQTLDERMPEIVDDLIDQVESLTGSGDTRQRILAALGGALGPLLGGERPPLSRLIAELLAAEGNKPLAALLSSLGIAADTPLGAVCAIDEAKKKRLDEWLCARLLRIADEQLENALASINVRAMVAERIDSLEMIRVERIILDVMANQLKWIDVFGAVLGFAIGLSQSLLSWLLR